MSTVYLAGCFSSESDPAVMALTDWFSKNDREPVNILVAYPFLKGFLKFRHRFKIDKWMLDSGAFSAFNSGVTINLDEYIATCQSVDADEVVALDAIGDYKQGIKNTEKMWAAGVPAIPVYHPGEPWSVLKWACDGADKIGIGSGRDLSKKVGNVRGAAGAQKYIEQVFARAWPKKIHGFALTRHSVCCKFPFHSVDSTTWILNPQGFGHWPQRANRPVSQVYLGTRQIKSCASSVDAFLHRQAYYRHLWRKEMELLDKCSVQTT